MARLGTHDPVTGTLSNGRTLGVVIHTRGENTTACEARSGGTNVPGGWSAGSFAESQRIAASELKALCVSEDIVYLPDSTWKDSAGRACTCLSGARAVCE